MTNCSGRAARISTALAQLERQTRTTAAHFDNIDVKLTAAFDVLERCGDGYATAPQQVERLFNQPLFAKIILIADDNAKDGLTVTTEFQAPFDALIRLAGARPATDGPLTRDLAENEKVGTSQSRLGRFSLSKRCLVELRGFEPLTFSLRTRRATNCATAPKCSDRLPPPSTRLETQRLAFTSATTVAGDIPSALARLPSSTMSRLS